MRYKDDWEIVKKRFELFWQRDILDRCCLSVKALDAAVEAEAGQIPTDENERVKYWTDPDWIIARNRRRMEHTYFGGESFPCIFVNQGAAGHAGFFRGESHRYGESVWFFPSISDPRQLCFDENSAMYQTTLALAKAFSEDSAGDYMVSMPDATGNADALSHLMGPDALLPMMLEDPDAIQDALGKIETAYERIMRDVYSIVKDVNDGGSCVEWLSTWSPGLHAQMQCDMSVMISGSMFEAFIKPELMRQSAFLRHALYHFDGAEQVRHLDTLLSIRALNAIQWTQVAGQKPCTEYFPELRRIQAAEKNLVLLVTPQQIEPIMENLSSRGLLLVTSAASRDEADRLLKMVEKMTHD